MGKVRDLAEPTYVKVKDILPGKSGYNLHLKVVSKNVLIDIVRLDTTRVVIADFVVGDETGTVKMRLRNAKENFVDIINEGETITVRNCKVPVVNNHMRMQVDAFGKIEAAQTIRILDVKMDKDFSAIVYDQMANNRKRYGDNNRDNFRENRSQFTDTQSVGTFLSSQVGIKN